MEEEVAKLQEELKFLTEENCELLHSLSVSDQPGCSRTSCQLCCISHILYVQRAEFYESENALRVEKLEVSV